ncbi:xylan 1,4-beta-xylosidase [Ranunculus cassubicifolius]
MLQNYQQHLLIIILLISISPLTIKSHPHPQYPCKPPHHNSYTFCNTSLPISTRAQSIISLLTLTEKITQLCNNASAIPRLGIPAYEWWSESLHGIATNGPGVSFNGTIPSATSFPQVLVTAAAFNRSLWFEIGKAVAVEARAMYNVGQAGLTFWAPNINIFRDPRWGRGQETPGEDPMTASAYAIAYVKGFQGGEDGPLMVSACCKHFTAYDLENWGNFTRYTFNAVVTPQDMQDTYQPPFQSCIQDAKASCLMCGYNEVNGIPACADKNLLQQARSDWGFNGYIASDCDAVATVYEYQHYAQSPEDAVADVIKAGTDINCGTYMLLNTQSAINQGKVQEEDIDRALFNLFSVQLRLGLFDGNPAKGKFGKLGPHNVCTKEHKKLALEAAKQGIVLLKNDKNFLPLEKTSITSLAVIGPLGNVTSLGGTYTGIPCNPKSYLDGFQAYTQNVKYAPGCDSVSCQGTNGFSEAIDISQKADVVVVVAGLDLTQETEDLDRVSLLLPGKQMDLIVAVSLASKRPIVLVLTGGGPIDVSFAKVNPKIASIIWVGYPGETGGLALAEIIYGDCNPGGRLPMTWYPESFTSVPMSDMRMRSDMLHGYPGRSYRFYTGERVYGFGEGLSYTNYSYKFASLPSKISLLRSSSIKKASRNILYQRREELDHIQIDQIPSCDALNFYTRISVKNNGNMSGSHVVMLFSRQSIMVEGSPWKQLIGFNRVHTEAFGATETSIFVEPCKHLSIVDEVGERILKLGNHVLMLDGLEQSISIDIE